ncbi:hypothetical protein STA3757_13970 [Stanieria sp. NIES-3757]|nr:hypothetical protein STA3757_13970 [Stanieria sp. NIES-3757]
MNFNNSNLLDWVAVFGYLTIATVVMWQVLMRNNNQ